MRLPRLLTILPFVSLLLSTLPVDASAAIVLERTLVGITNLDSDRIDNDHRFNLDGAGGMDVVRCDTCAVREVVDLAMGAVLWSFSTTDLGIVGARLVGFADLDDDGGREAVFECTAGVSPPGKPVSSSCGSQVLVVDPNQSQVKLQLEAPGHQYAIVFLGDVDNDQNDELVVTHFDGLLSTTEVYGSGVTTAVSLRELAATFTGEAVRLTWSFSEPPGDELLGIGVQRAEAVHGAYLDLATTGLGLEMQMSFEDAQVQHGATYWYRLVLLRSDGNRSTSAPVGIVAGPALPATDFLLVSGAEGGPIAVRYRLARSGSAARLGVYDVTGRLVRLLADNVRSSGDYTVSWDRTNEGGAFVARGVYWVRLESSDVSITRKIVLARH